MLAFLLSPLGKLAGAAGLILALGIGAVAVLHMHDDQVRADQSAALAATAAAHEREVLMNAAIVDQKVREDADPAKTLREKWERPDEPPASSSDGVPAESAADPADGDTTDSTDSDKGGSDDPK